MNFTKKYLSVFIMLFLFFSLLMLVFTSVSFTIKSHNQVTQYHGVYWLDFPVHESQTEKELKSIASLCDEKLTLSNFKINSYLVVNGIKLGNTASSNIFNLSKPVKDLRILRVKFSQEKIGSVKTPMLFILCFAFLLSVLTTLSLILIKFMKNSEFFTRDIDVVFFKSEKLLSVWELITKNGVLFCVIIFIGSRLYFIIDFKLLTLFYHGISFPSSMLQWDANYYFDIVKNGYLHSVHPDFTKQTNWAFFPAFPIIIKFIVDLGGDFLISAIIFNQIISLLSVIVLYNYLEISASKNIASWGAILLAFSPATIYFMSPYTEALFIFLSLVTVNLLYREKFFCAAIICGVLVATRVVGSVMPLVILFVYSRNYFVKSRQACVLKFILKFMLIVLVSFSGLITYMFYLRHITGDYLAFYHIQKAWSKPDVSGWLNPIFALFGLLRSGNLIDLMFFFLSLWIGCLLYKYKRYNELFFFVGCCLVPIAAQSLDSYARFTLGNYSFYIALALFAERRKIYTGVFTVLFMLAMLAYLVVWVSGYGGIQ